MRHVLPRTAKNEAYVESLPKIYGVHLWARYGVREYDLACWKKNEYGDMIPYVYYYEDHNGTTDQFELKPLDYTTTGSTLCWTMSKSRAEEIANALNKE